MNNQEYIPEEEEEEVEDTGDGDFVFDEKDTLDDYEPQPKRSSGRKPPRRMAPTRGRGGRGRGAPRRGPSYAQEDEELYNPNAANGNHRPVRPTRQTRQRKYEPQPYTAEGEVEDEPAPGLPRHYTRRSTINYPEDAEAGFPPHTTPAPDVDTPARRTRRKPPIRYNEERVDRLGLPERPAQIAQKSVRLTRSHIQQEVVDTHTEEGAAFDTTTESTEPQLPKLRINLRSRETEPSPPEVDAEDASIARRLRNRKRKRTDDATYAIQEDSLDQQLPSTAGTHNDNKDPDFSPPGTPTAADDDDFYLPEQPAKRRRSTRSSAKRKQRRSSGRSPNQVHMLTNDDDEYVEMQNDYSDDEGIENELFDEDFDLLLPQEPGVTIRRMRDDSDSDPDDQIKLRDRKKLRKRRPLFSRMRSKQKGGSSDDRYDRLLHMAHQFKKSPSKFPPMAGTVGVNFPSLSAAMSSFKEKEPKRVPLSFESSDSDDDMILSPTSRQQRNDDRYSHLMPINQSDFSGEKKPKRGLSGDLDPITIEENITFDSIGGLEEHIRGLKEMVLLPLMYPEIFQKFQLNPPKGVIFCGPPGCGKTLMARAIANMCKRSSGRPIAFFMRKGADILSKWVGEAEKQLRMLFEQATKMQPSIIFFDEIDGLAPVRSSKQDYIHSSIVSTLLALMDGLDNRGQVVVIGATNRVDAIDPALRRPGRFDRELHFKLPDEPTRRKILEIHTKHWSPPLAEDLKDTICRKTVGYCGADIKALCAETALRSLRRVYPQIYDSQHKLAIDVANIEVQEQDFNTALSEVVPSYHRSTIVHSSPLPGHLHAALASRITDLDRVILRIFPIGNSQKGGTQGFSLPVHRPWFLLYGEEGMGQTEISKALLHYSLSNLPMVSLSYNTLMSSEMSNRTVEAALIDQIAEAKRQAPSVVFIPNIDEWWALFQQNPIIIHSLISMLSDIPSETPVFVLATSTCSLDDLPDLIRKNFAKHSYELTPPLEDHRRALWEYYVKQIKKPAISKAIHFRNENMPVLPKAQTQVQEKNRMVEAKRKEVKKRHKEEEKFLRDLRITLRDCVVRVLGDRRFNAFRKPSIHHIPVDNEEPRLMYVLDILEKLEDFEYTTVESFMADFREMVQNSEHYHPRPGARSDFSENRQRLVSTANQLYEVLKSFVDSIPRHLKRRCREISERRQLEEESKGLDAASTDSPATIISTVVQIGNNEETPDAPFPNLQLNGMTPTEPEDSSSTAIDVPNHNLNSHSQTSVEDLSVVVSDELIDDLREGLVAFTTDYSVTQLDELFSFLMGILYRHRFDRHRDPLVRELKRELDNW
eukprot:CAMPEP_0117445828 /NCGR_PEP_ID=MMETSP0759-20121206/6007_1 /TAXON_ID=63605 /ORGANISM="Percolomonas cosmopolitus, Strain WS" /LENGTH=1318 /DNA_ID=CAMNT_0005238037 /DNA_START=281 /DNA_END=4234 /DNA_ORIENTATION=-